MNRQIQALIKFGKMKNNDSIYAYRVNLSIKRDGNRWFSGDYRSLNMQTKRDSFPMPLIDNVPFQMGNIQWFNDWIYNLVFGRFECYQMTLKIYL